MMTMQDDSTSDPFIGVRRLVGDAAWERVREAEVGVIGVGGVGSWAAEMLVRSGVGRLVLIDLDDICVTNVNRQLQALPETVGQLKVDALADRLRRISPGSEVVAVSRFFTAAAADELLAMCPDGVIDAIDSIRHKASLVASCHGRGVPVVVAGAAAGRIDPCRVRCRDLALATHDPLLRELRKRLRTDYGFPRADQAPFGIPAVHSEELPNYPDGEGGVCGRMAPGAKVRVACDSAMGSAGYVTGAFGMAAAGRLMTELCRGVDIG